MNYDIKESKSGVHSVSLSFKVQKKVTFNKMEPLFSIDSMR